MGRKSRDKGVRREREVAALLHAERIPLSGAAGGGFTGDMLWGTLRVEVKSRADGWRELYRWLEFADLIVMKADRKGWLVCLPLERFLALTGHTEDSPITS